MFKRILLSLGKSLFKDIAHELITTVVDQVQVQITQVDKLSEKEQATANMVLDLVEQRAFEFIDSKLS